MLRMWPRGSHEFWLAEDEALLLTSSAAHGSTPIRNWSGPLPIGSKVRARFVPVPFALWRILASGAELLPGAPITRNQVALIQRDNIAADCPGLSSLDIA